MMKPRLIADDEATIAEMVAEVVDLAGYTALVARDEVQVLALAREHRPALVVTDLMVPRLGGAGLIGALRADAATNEHIAPITILMTAAAPGPAGGAGADIILAKPFDLDALEALLHRFLVHSPSAQSIG